MLWPEWSVVWPASAMLDTVRLFRCASPHDLRRLKNDISIGTLTRIDLHFSKVSITRKLDSFNREAVFGRPWRSLVCRRSVTERRPLEDAVGSELYGELPLWTCSRTLHAVLQLQTVLLDPTTGSIESAPTAGRAISPVYWPA